MKTHHCTESLTLLSTDPKVSKSKFRPILSRGGLNTHLASHDNTRMFQCGSCDMMFTTAGSARRHMAVHQVSPGEYCHRVDDVIGSEIKSQNRDCTDKIRYNPALTSSLCHTHSFFESFENRLKSLLILIPIKLSNAMQMCGVLRFLSPPPHSMF